MKIRDWLLIVALVIIGCFLMAYCLLQLFIVGVTN